MAVQKPPAPSPHGPSPLSGMMLLKVVNSAPGLGWAAGICAHFTLLCLCCSGFWQTFNEWFREELTSGSRPQLEVVRRCRASAWPLQIWTQPDHHDCYTLPPSARAAGTTQTQRPFGLTLLSGPTGETRGDCQQLMGTPLPASCTLQQRIYGQGFMLCVASVAGSMPSACAPLMM
jgi:hypothetical protein